MSDSIYVLMGRVLAELPAIGKTDYNPQQKFHFRGIDAVLNALNPLLAKHGVFYVPEVLERTEGERQTKGGSAMYVVNLHVRYRFFGPNGDSVEASAWGEGTDMGDKATNKAMTGAMKYVLFQTFAISTQEASEADADRYVSEESVPVALAPIELVADLHARIRRLSDEAKAALKADWRSGGLSPLAHLLASDADDATDLVRRYETSPAGAPSGDDAAPVPPSAASAHGAPSARQSLSGRGVPSQGKEAPTDTAGVDDDMTVNASGLAPRDGTSKPPAEPAPSLLGGGA